MVVGVVVGSEVLLPEEGVVVQLNMDFKSSYEHWSTHQGTLLSPHTCH